VNKLSGGVTGVRNDLDEAKGRWIAPLAEGRDDGLIARQPDDWSGMKQRGAPATFRIHHLRAKAPRMLARGYRAEQTD